MTNSWIPVGRVRSVNAKSREVRLTVQSGYGYAFDGLAWIGFERAPGDVLRCKVVAVRGGETVVVVLAPGVSRDDVGKLKGLRAVVAPDELPPKPGGTWRPADWLGFQVLLPDGEPLGSVCEIFEGPANDAFAVRRPDGSRCILPAIEAVIRSIDSDGGTIGVGDVVPYIVEA